MVLEQNVQMLWNMKLNIKFDNDTSKETIIEEGMYLLVKFRRNGNTYSRAGRVINVQPVLLETQPVSFTGCLEMDFSGKYRASRIRIGGHDILNFRVVTQAQIENLGPDYVITDDMFEETTVLPALPDETEEGNGVDLAGPDASKVME